MIILLKLAKKFKYHFILNVQGFFFLKNEAVEEIDYPMKNFK